MKPGVSVGERDETLTAPKIMKNRCRNRHRFARKITPAKSSCFRPADDGIVVEGGQKGDGRMLVNDVPAPLRERLGPEGTNGLLEILERTRDESVAAAMTACTDRFERRLVETSSALRLETAGLRQEMHDGFAAVRQEMRDGFAALRHEIATRHADQLKWSFLFWVGQVAVVAGLFGVLLRVIR